MCYHIRTSVSLSQNTQSHTVLTDSHCWCTRAPCDCNEMKWNQANRLCHEDDGFKRFKLSFHMPCLCEMKALCTTSPLSIGLKCCMYICMCEHGARFFFSLSSCYFGIILLVIVTSTLKCTWVCSVSVCVCICCLFTVQCSWSASFHFCFFLSLFQPFVSRVFHCCWAVLLLLLDSVFLCLWFDACLCLFY